MKRKVLFPLMTLLMGSTQMNAENWMSRLPDSTYVAVVSIPGAHDAATGSGWASGSEWMGESFAQTQDLSLSEQWSVGVRAFDLRPCVKDDYLNINHGIVATSVRFDDALCLIRDSLVANPSEFVILHVQHETDGDDNNSSYNKMLLEVLKREDLKDYFVDFKSDLLVSDMRGKILILSRNEYATTPIGGFFKDWSFGTNWKTSKKIAGPKSKTGAYFQQDFYNTVDAIETKVRVFSELLDYSVTRKTTKKAEIRWIFNFASGYSKTSFGYPSSDGYRDNATHTHDALLEYLANSPGGPTGVVMMDYVGADKSSKYDVRGLEAVQAIIDNNFKYLHNDTTSIAPIQATFEGEAAIYSLSGTPLAHPQEGINIVREADGTIRKVLYKE
ncbi:MAG: hypothetical protein IKY64_04190 [Bacteroidaceae bacterium]|nr:hypothetical protein [Bacteroidaceae bacterium]